MFVAYLQLQIDERMVVQGELDVQIISFHADCGSKVDVIQNFQRKDGSRIKRKQDAQKPFEDILLALHDAVEHVIVHKRVINFAGGG